MINEDKDGKLALILVIIASIPLMMWMNVSIFKQAWVWHIVPLGFAKLTTYKAFGVLSVYWCIKGSGAEKSDSDKSFLSKLGVGVICSLLTFFISWCLK